MVLAWCCGLAKLLRIKAVLPYLVGHGPCFRVSGLLVARQKERLMVALTTWLVDETGMGCELCGQKGVNVFAVRTAACSLAEVCSPCVSRVRAWVVNGTHEGVRREVMAARQAVQSGGDYDGTLDLAEARAAGRGGAL
jgi:hypothetical protein